ncbi:signal recognition particle-docking protein FtsY [Methanobacterium petrolearium]|uniref:signal recognition particle-docking protein FtsY n=1 Tax=Methanobacterium petrolearium TaxID=710190 RepID=UPI001AE24437|nr:signal recognition particle-docking protein FtsY [Methanobacterium petrolearium]MBP1946648.1 fused signal recognition particle receptor [Methanobacterium petrolearium]BDZ72127.1 signal recognition particle-docking protein FtsY [Methanobacterium petrolearium]
MFESLKKKFSGAIGKISDEVVSEEETAKSEEKKAKSTLNKDRDKKSKDKKVETTSKKVETLPKESTEDNDSKTPSLKDRKDESSQKGTDEEEKSRFSFLRRKYTDEDSTSTDEDSTKTELKDVSDSETDLTKSEDVAEEEPSGLFTFATHKTISEKDVDDILFELELALLEGDVALEVSEQIVKSVKDNLVGRKIKRRNDVAKFTKEALKNAISDILVVEGPDLEKLVKDAKKTGEPLKIMFVGVNGTGKTTTISKIADYYLKEGYTPVIAASDTFRAGAIEQISHHAEKVGVKIIRHQKGADPAAVAYDAVEHARAQKKELVLIDTAGRMQTNVNLMDEMKKIQRVVKPELAIFVGDALTGNDAVEQARKFDDAVGVDGIILTKADADAKGGAALSIGHVINKPILFLGVGQGYGDIMEFHPDWMVEQVLGD